MRPSTPCDFGLNLAVWRKLRFLSFFPFFHVFHTKQNLVVAYLFLSPKHDPLFSVVTWHFLSSLSRHSQAENFLDGAIIPLQMFVDFWLLIAMFNIDSLSLPLIYLKLATDELLLWICDDSRSAHQRLESSSPSSKEVTHKFNMNVDVATAQTSSHVATQRAKDFAVAEAREDHCTGNFKIFDSPFGNFLLPVIPTRAELADK